MAAFQAFAVSRPEGLVLLIDTYETEAAARKVVALAPRLHELGISIRGVRLDSGDLIALSRRAAHPRRRRLARAIFASGGIDEDELAAIVRSGAPSTASASAPA